MDRECNHSHWTGISAAFLLGAVAGGVAALLLAPASGAETRRKLKEKVDSLRRKGGELAGEIREAAAAAKDAYQREASRS